MTSFTSLKPVAPSRCLSTTAQPYLPEMSDALVNVDNMSKRSRCDLTAEHASKAFLPDAGCVGAISP